MDAMRFPNESADYRTKRNALLEAEIRLRDQTEEVARMRRELPPGGELKQDYVFTEERDAKTVETSFSDLFREGHDTLFLYNFMYAPTMNNACFMCSAFLDGLNGQIHHLERQISTAVVAKVDSKTLTDFAASRGWNRFRLLSSQNSSFNGDYFGEANGHQLGVAHVFQRKDGVIRHCWSSEMITAESVEGGDKRLIDMMWPLWNVLDTTPNGRGNWHPSLDYK